MPAGKLYFTNISDRAISAALKLQQNVITLTFLQNNPSDLLRAYMSVLPDNGEYNVGNGWDFAVGEKEVLWGLVECWDDIVVSGQMGANDKFFQWLIPPLHQENQTCPSCDYNLHNALLCFWGNCHPKNVDIRISQHSDSLLLQWQHGYPE